MILIRRDILEDAKEYLEFGVENKTEIGSVLSGYDNGNNIIIDNLNLPYNKDIFVSNCKLEKLNEKDLEKLIKEYDLISNKDSCIITTKYYEKINMRKLLGIMHIHLVSGKLKPSSPDIKSCFGYTQDRDIVLQMIFGLNKNFKIFGLKSFDLVYLMDQDIILDEALDKWVEQNYNDLILDFRILD